MNETLSLLHGHRSDRSFKDQPVSDDALDAIIEAARRAPTSLNAQHISLVVIRDAARRARIAEAAGGQAWVAKAPVFIAVLLDFYKTGLAVEAAGEVQVIHESLEGLVAGLIDVGIALEAMVAAARSLHLGIVPIGGIRRNPQALIDLLQLPPRTFPAVGISVGYVDQPAHQKPRLPLQAFRHDEFYQCAGLEKAIAAYDAELMDYWKRIGRSDGKPWSQNTADSYKRVYFPEVRPVAIKQGLTFTK